MDYAVELYRLLLRDLVKDIVRELSENPKETLEAEMEYIRKRLEDKRAGFLLERVLNEQSYWEWMAYENMGYNLEENYKRSQEVDFSSIRENGEHTKDIVWILIKSIAKYPKVTGDKEKIEDGDIALKTRNSYRQFGQLLEKMGFTNEEKELFRYDGDTFYFNALIDNGNMVYIEKQNLFPSDNGWMYDMNHKSDALFKIALKVSELHEMHGKLRDVIEDYNKLKKKEEIREVDVQIIIQIAEKLSDLVPIIDRDSKLKSEKQLENERIAVRFVVLSHFLPQGKNNHEKMIEEWKKSNFESYCENQIFIKAFLGKLYERDAFNDKQILVITEEYLHFQEQDLKCFKDKVEQYKEICKTISDKDYPIEVYRDAWKQI